MVTTAKFVKDWESVNGTDQLKDWTQKYLTPEQKTRFDEQLGSLIELWLQKADDENGKATVRTSSGIGWFDPPGETDPILENIDYLAVELSILPSGNTYTIFIPYKEDVILDSIACLPGESVVKKLH